MAFTFRRSDFPAGFEFGVSTSAYQIEGHSFGGAGSTHWDTFAATPGNVVRAENGAVACDHYHRFGEDLDLIRDCGMDSYRFSTSWARVLPDGQTPNEEGLDFYERLVDGCLERGIKPYACLYHWELPSALADLGGWTNRDIAERFADFATLVMGRIGDRLAGAATFNEPWCIAWLSHFMGQHAPGLRDVRATARAMHHVLLAHGRGTQAMRVLGMSNLGVVMNFEYAQAVSESEADRAAAHLYDGIYNRWFVEAMTRGTYPADVLEGFAPHMPEGWEADLEVIHQPLDWFGVNYYTCQRLTGGVSETWPHYGTGTGDLPKTAMGWEICPEGLTYTLRRLAAEYTHDTPLFVTENGLANPDMPGRPDRERIEFTDLHLRACLDAIAAGVPLTGYTAWSLLDNYEWAFGYEKRFGLVHVDFETQERTPKASFHALARALAPA